MDNKKGLAGGVIALVVIAFIVIIVSTAAQNTLTGIGSALSAIPAWLRIGLFVGVIIIAVRLSSKQD